MVKVFFYFLQNMKHGPLIISFAPFQIRFLLVGFLYRKKCQISYMQSSSMLLNYSLRSFFEINMK
jgi:hypothetical protein